ncbi:MAG: DNA alkylation repair protein [Bacteroidales bacterium]
MDIKETLLSLTQDGYKEFSQGLIPTNKNTILGVRLPQLRSLAEEIAKNNWREFLEAYELNSSENIYYEEIMLQGMVINYAKMDIKERLALTEKFVPKIDNWAVCDNFCCGAKWVLKSKKQVWSFIQKYFNGSAEFDLRFGVIMLLSYYLDKEYVCRVLQIVDGIKVVGKTNCICADNVDIIDEDVVKKIKKGKRDKKSGITVVPPNYYVEMAVAWCLATAAAKCRDEFMEYIQKSNISAGVLKKAAQKMRDSYRISNDDKELITKIAKNSIN